MIPAAILAADASRRFWVPKQLLRWRGTTVVKALASEICASACERAAIVLGAHADLIAPEVDGLPIVALPNDAWRDGLESSIRVAVDWAREHAAPALVIATCDQPRLTAKHVDRLCRAHAMAARSVVSRYAGSLGLPAVVDATDFDQIAETGELPDAFAIDWPDGAYDVDTVIRRRIS